MICASRGPNRRPRGRRLPGLESLEGRQMMSLSAEFAVNTKTFGDQFESAGASSPSNGNSVIVWTDSFSATDHDIHAQLYRSNGTRLGTELVVAGSSLDDRDPAVAMGRDGSFVVTWTQTQTNGDTNVLAQRFNASGVRQGGVVPVGVGTFKEHDPSVAEDNAGNFVVAYTRDTNNNNPDVFAKRYNASGQLLSVTSVATSARAEGHASVAVNPRTGAFDVAYQLAFSATDDDIDLGRFSASGADLGTRAIAVSGAREQAPSLAMDSSGRAVVAYQKLVGNSYDIEVRRVNSSGFVGPEITVANSTANELNPSVALRGSGGQFVVAYEQHTTLPPVIVRSPFAATPAATTALTRGLFPPIFPIFFRTSVIVKEFSASNTPVATFNAGVNRAEPSVSFGVGDHYLLSDTSLVGTAADPGEGIRGRRGLL